MVSARCWSVQRNSRLGFSPAGRFRPRRTAGKPVTPSIPRNKERRFMLPGLQTALKAAARKPSRALSEPPLRPSSPPAFADGFDRSPFHAETIRRFRPPEKSHEVPAAGRPTFRIVRERSKRTVQSRGRNGGAPNPLGEDAAPVRGASQTFLGVAQWVRYRRET